MDAFLALADPTRRQIIESLANGESAFGELADQFDMSRPAVSQHLKVLREAGLVHVRKDAQRRIYRLNAEGLEASEAPIEPAAVACHDVRLGEVEAGETCVVIGGGPILSSIPRSRSMPIVSSPDLMSQPALPIQETATPSGCAVS